jgi:hypothetical protein
MAKASNVSVLSGWRLKLFDNLLDNGLMVIKKDKRGNNRLVATNKFMRIVNRKMRTRK